MNNVLILPLFIPLGTGIILLMISSMRWQRIINLAGSGLLFLASLLLLRMVYLDGIQVLRLGNWPAPFAITFAVDMISALMVTVTGFVALNIAIYSLAGMDAQRQKFGFYPLLNILLMGVCGAFMTGDLFNLYVWFEVMLMASFILMALGGERKQLEGAVKYLTLNFIASIFFLTATGMIYGKTGTLNLADLAYRMSDITDTGLIRTSVVLLLAAFGIKAGVFPLYFWLPASYHTPPATVSAVFAGLLTKVGVYAMIRIFTLVFQLNMPFLQPILLVIAGMTMVSGVLGAAVQFDFRRILSFHIISQIGYMVLGLAIYTPLALAATVFYLFHHIIVKTNLFLIGGIANHLQGSYQLKKLGGLYRHYPLLALLFLIPALSLGGIPPLSGFFAKFVIIKAGLIGREYILVFVALLVGVLTIYSMTKIWTQAFWSKEKVPVNSTSRIPPALIIPVILMAAATVLIGIFAEPLMHISQIAAEQLMNPADYIQSVLWGKK
jgi:multicomponent Na+:H+ antiporter subunit D